MGIQIATGKSRCIECSTKIPAGADCWKIATIQIGGYLCTQCINSMVGLVNRTMAEIVYEMRPVDMTSGNNFYQAKQTWPVELSDGTQHAHRAVAEDYIKAKHPNAIRVQGRFCHGQMLTFTVTEPSN